MVQTHFTLFIAPAHNNFYFLFDDLREKIFARRQERSTQVFLHHLSIYYSSRWRKQIFIFFDDITDATKAVFV